MNMEGYVNFFRKMQIHEVAKDPIRFAVWCHILMSVCYKKERKIWAGKEVEILPGEIIISLDKLSQQCSVPKHRVRTSLKWLELNHMISTKSDTKGTRVKVLNWEIYQGFENTDNTNLDTTQEYLY